MNSNDKTAAIVLNNVSKNYGDFTALHGVDLTINDNEFFTLLGPSGCGKTTLLRMIAGFEATSSGEIYLYGDEIETLPPDKRPVNTVFQSYALFPHMSVAQNIGFGMKMLRWPENEIAERIQLMISLVRLDEFAHRKPSQLSGGQQQRVALARAMAPRPKVLLLDEPLSALDLKLRQQMRIELKELQCTTGITFVFVTHDQEEALSMSDRIAVMSAGRVQQIGPPTNIYEQPCNQFVADFIGDTNLLGVEITQKTDSKLFVKLATGELLTAPVQTEAASGATGHVSIRPERIVINQQKIADQDTDPVQEINQLNGTIEQAVYQGTDWQYQVRLSDQLHVRVLVKNSEHESMRLKSGDAVWLSMEHNAVRFLAS